MRDQEIIDLWEAYSSIYSQSKEKEVINENLDENLQTSVEKGIKAAAKNPVIKAIGKVIAPVGKGRQTPTATSGGYRPVKEDVDTFDIVLEYLVSEGFAETNENALAIMANMSEGWKQTILEREMDEPGERDNKPDVRAHNRAVKYRPRSRRPRIEDDPRYGTPMDRSGKFKD